MTYDYKVVPAPVRGLKAKGLKSAEDRFAHALESAMNELAADGWEYLRADTLPCEQREGLMSKTTVFQNMLVFRRAKKAAAPAVAPPAPQFKAARPKTGEERLAAIKAQSAPIVRETPLEIGDTPSTEAKPKSAPSSDVAAE